MSLFTNLTYAEQLAEIDSLNFNSYYTSDLWGELQIADYYAVAVLYWSRTVQEVTTTFTPSFVSTDADNKLNNYYNGRYGDAWLYGSQSYTTGLYLTHVEGDSSWLAGGFSPYILPDVRSVDLGAWVTAEASAPVPEPATMFLLGSGLIGLAGFRGKVKKS